MPSTFRTLERDNESISPSKKASPYPRLQALSAPHLDGFNSIFQYKLPNDPTNTSSLLEWAVQDIGKKVIFDNTLAVSEDPSLGMGNKLEIWIENVNISKPLLSDSVKGAIVREIYPAECRERGSTYKGKIQAKVCWRVNNGPVASEIKTLGHMPIMIRSLKCNLYKKSPAELVRHNEDMEEFGGYFIVNGIERLIRLLIAPRRNHPVALIRPSFQKRGPTYTDKGVQIRCVRPDQTAQTMTMHYCSDGNVTLRFSYRKQEYMVPIMLVLKSLMEASDKDVFERIMMGKSERGAKDTFLTDRVELLLRGFKRYQLYNQKSCLEYLGSKFHIMLDSPEDMASEEIGREFLRSVICVHLDNDRSKFDLLIFMIQKLYALVSGDCVADNPDSPMHQEVLLGGHVYLAYFKEKLADFLIGAKTLILQDLRRNRSGVDFHDNKYIQRVLNKNPSDLGRKLEYFLATGNVVSNTGLDLQQVSGFTIVAEKLNFYRYISHFRSIHRGAFFAELKTTTVRKLLPEAWGFLCPVHTPDGSPCGLLNHLSHTCKITIEPLDTGRLPGLVAGLGVSQVGVGMWKVGDHVELLKGGNNGMDVDSSNSDSSDSENDNENDEDAEDYESEQTRLWSTTVCVQLDGRIIGWCSAERAQLVAQQLRHWKVTGHEFVPKELEIGFVPPMKGGQYPGLFLFSTPTRMMRPVKYLPTGGTDLLGSFEQVYMDVACLKEDIVPGVTTHIEFTPTNILSVVANLTPFSDFNQSPRNMYQCQMGKQSMGTPAHALPHRADNKLYRLQTGQTPVVRPFLHNEYGMDNYPNGMNAIVCVISYTGYDMEDAMILNKSSFERGFGYGSIYKSEIIDLSERRQKGEPIHCHFGLVAKEGGKRLGKEEFEKVTKFLDIDGLPIIGKKLTDGDPLYAYVDDISGTVKIGKFKGMEDAYVDEVRLLGSDNGDQEAQKLHIKFRIPRPPIIGDKFSSRHGQKGVCSQKWPLVDMPFSESGIVPDVIINPHAFPSRMTIGMFVESIAGKAGALYGNAQDSTPFTFSEDFAAADFFGDQLRKAGYNYYGNEPMYSGITGQEFKADIYIGVVYYQRLRHMVSDKYQVRTTGPVHNLTQQPVKGRKRAGGIRFGEMERDSLLAHGTSFLLQDRLMNCSDYSQAYVCSTCGSILSPVQVPGSSNMSIEEATALLSEGHPEKKASVGHHNDKDVKVLSSQRERVECRTCESAKGVVIVPIPYVFRYFATELMAMGVKLTMEVK